MMNPQAAGASRPGLTVNLGPDSLALRVEQLLAPEFVLQQTRDIDVDRAMSIAETGFRLVSLKFQLTFHRG